VASYSLGNKAFLKGLTWDRETSKYAALAAVPLTGEPPLTGAPALSVIHPGSGVTLIEARASGGGYVEGVSLYEKTSRGIEAVRMVDEKGETAPAYFLSGATVRHVEKVEFRDVSGDGTAAAVSTSTDISDAAGTVSTVRAFKWTDGAFKYDADLSRLLGASEGLFPEPGAGVVTSRK
jgi:hypothetical protein